MVYVLDKDGQPLMPTNRHGKVNHLLKDGKAKVVKRCPFTIRLLYETTRYTQDLTLGVDTGSGTLGTAVSDDDGNIYYTSKVIVRNDIAKKMTQRRKYRRSRRNRKTRYRKARWLNRKNSIKKDRFSPTMRSKLYSHVKEIEYIKKILPIKRLVLETGTFDPHLMKNPILANEKVRHWGYQKGPNYGYENTRAMVLARDKYTCLCCKGKRKDSRLEVHHKIYRCNGGSDDEENLATTCHSCHEDIHKGILVPKWDKKGTQKGTLSFATQMNSIRKQLLRQYPDAVETFGYITKANRFQLGVEKDHHLDACVVASGGSKPIRFKTNIVYLKKSVSDGDYQHFKGVRSEKPIPVRKMFGFRKFDKVKYLGKEYFIKGRMASGYARLMDITGKEVDFSKISKECKTPKMSKFLRINARTSCLITTENIVFYND